jgi:hypothetical protein
LAPARRVDHGDEVALAELFARYRARLCRMIKLRLDRRLQWRFDPSDVLQEANLDVAGRPRDPGHRCPATGARRTGGIISCRTGPFSPTAPI